MLLILSLRVLGLVVFVSRFAHRMCVHVCVYACYSPPKVVPYDDIPAATNPCKTP